MCFIEYVCACYCVCVAMLMCVHLFVCVFVLFNIPIYHFVVVKVWYCVYMCIFNVCVLGNVNVCSFICVCVFGLM